MTIETELVEKYLRTIKDGKEKELANDYLNALKNGETHEERERIYLTYTNNIEGMRMNWESIDKNLLHLIKLTREEDIRNNHQTLDNRA